MSIELKVKTKSLAAEAVIIRKEEKKALKQTRWLRQHQHGAITIDKAHLQYFKLQYHRCHLQALCAVAQALSLAF